MVSRLVPGSTYRTNISSW